MTNPRQPIARGIKAVNWWTSPSCARYMERLECRGESTPERIATDCHTQPKYAYALLRKLHDARVIHVSGWRHNINGAPTPIYALGPGRDAAKPKAETASQRAKRRRKPLRELYGREIAARVLNPKHYGHPRIHIDGVHVTPGAHTSQIVGKVSR